MSSSIGIRELRQQASAVLRRVAAGETFEVTDHGHPVARIVPFRVGSLDRLLLEGSATEAAGDLVDVADALGLPVPTASSTRASEALVELRADAR